jgi:SAM-dependent methyltransferase
MDDSQPVDDPFLATLGTVSPGLHETVLGLLGPLPRGRVLDVPSGEGRLSYLMRKAGFDVTAGDIDPGIFKVGEIPCIGVDLNKPLTIDNNTYDIITCIEGIEHVENSFHVCRELSRILKPGGILILSTPNILSINSRCRYLLTGQFAFFGGYYGDESKMYTYHINPAPFPLLSLALRKAAFTIDTMTTNRSCLRPYSPATAIFLRMLAAVVRVVTKMREKDILLRKAFCSEELLMGENLIVQCRKKGP